MAPVSKTYNFDTEARLVCNAIDSKVGHMTVMSALYEAFEAGSKQRSSLPISKTRQQEILEKAIRGYVSEFEGVVEDEVIAILRETLTKDVTHIAHVIGFLGTKRIYIDVPIEEAKARWLKENPDYDLPTLETIGNGYINTFTFTDEFNVYEAWGL